MIFALLFRPVVLLRVIARLIFKLLRLLACCPCLVARVVLRRRRERRKRDAERRRSSVVKSKAVAHKLNSAEYKELYDAAHAIFEHCSRHDYTTSAESLFISRFATMVEMEAREAYDRTRAGPIPPSSAVVFHRQELPPPRTLTTTRLALSHFRDTGISLASLASPPGLRATPDEWAALGVAAGIRPDIRSVARALREGLEE